MTRPVTLSPVYNALTGNVSMANLDTTFGQVAAGFNELSNSSVYLVDTGAVNALAANPAPATVNIAEGTTLDILVSNTNTGPTTLTIAGSTGIVGAVPVKDGQGNTLTANTLLGNTVYRMILTSGVWRASGTFGGGGTGPVAATTLTASGQANLSQTFITTASGISLTVDVGGAGGGTVPNVFLKGTGTVGLSIGSNGAAVPGTNTFDFFQLITSQIGIIAQRANADLIIFTNNIERMRLLAGGGITIAAPTVAADSVTINSPSGGFSAITINGALGVPKLTMNSNVTTGGGQAQINSTAGILAINKPGGNTGVTKWLPVAADGTTYYIPMWS